MKLTTFLLPALASLVSATTTATDTTAAAVTPAAAAAAAAAPAAAAPPAAPALTYLYTSYVQVSAPIDMGIGPEGDRLAIPITGGNFTGPLLSGTIRNLGADWGLIDTKTGIFSPDTRYQFLTSDGANIFVRSAGSQVLATGEIHLRFQFETGSAKYYWLNNAITIGILKQLSATLLKIDTWHMSTDATA